MKNLIIFLIILVAAKANAQDIVATTGIEKTVAGSETFFSLSYENKAKWSLGGFYQTKINLPIAENNTTDSDIKWMGAVLNIPLIHTEKIDLFLKLRGGMVNDSFIVLSPAIETKVNITQRFGFGVWSGYRQGYPSFAANVHFKI